ARYSTGSSSHGTMWSRAKLSSSFFFFFFQAEDGIRDYKVTGVQTCALPISLQSDLHHLPGPRPGDWWPSPADLARRHLVGWRACRGAGRGSPASTRRPHSRPAPRLRKVTVTAIDASEAYGET